MPLLRALSGVAILALSLSNCFPPRPPTPRCSPSSASSAPTSSPPSRLGDVRWVPGSAAYTRLEPDSARRGAAALVRYDAATGRREVWVPAARLVPAGRLDAARRSRTTRVSPDRKRLLLFTNSRKVWRQNTRGDFWTLDLASWQLRKLGGPDAKPSTLMFAKFSPDGGRVAYVREHDLYVESLADGRITQLTQDGSRTIINGTFDWVYEEELNLRDGFRWSPDGRRIAYLAARRLGRARLPT